MQGAILSLPEQGEPVELHPEPYDTEAALQVLLAEHPSLLAGDQMDPDSPRRWLLVSREMTISDPEQGGPRWAIDHLFLDQEGIPTLVEVKRTGDTRLRREVVGQMLDYAANGLASWPLEAIQSAFERRCEDEGLSPVTALDDLLVDDTDEVTFWTRVQTNLQAGRIRLVLVADQIPSDTLRIIQFLAEQMRPATICAVEVRQYVGRGMKTLVPRVVGQSAPRLSSAARRSTDWSEDDFFRELQAQGEDLVPVARSLLAWGQQEPRYTRWGAGNHSGSFHVWIKTPEGAECKLFTVSTSGTVRVHLFLFSRAGLPVQAVQRVLGQLNTIPGVHLGDDTVNGMPKFNLRLLAGSEERHRYLDIMQDVFSLAMSAGVPA